MGRTVIHRVCSHPRARNLALAVAAGILITVPTTASAQSSTPEAIAPAASCTLSRLTLPLFGG
ncbi:MAG: hypothetical protein WBA46_06830, partial [Thermomicrobiales bacterium]